jgi:flagellin-specific chaperone FliS
MARFNGATTYSDMQIQTAGKLKSLQLLHEAGGKFAREAINNSDRRKELIIKAQNILAQLQMTLRLQDQAVAELLFYEYDYMFTLLQKGDETSLRNVGMLFDHLLLTFRMMGRGKRTTTAESA